ncbi:MAG: glycosyl hydrolase family 8 [Fibrobacterota bacterium]
MILKSLRYYTFLFMVPVLASAQLLPFPSTLPKVSTPYDTILLKTWEGIKKRNVDPWSTGLVHRPKSETPGDAVSEGVGYGMILALYSNDQEYFNKIWNGGEKYMWQGEYYDWRVNDSGEKTGTGAASDADEDIAMMLIFADLLVQKEVWEPYTSEAGATYASRARDILKGIRTTMLEGNYLKPGQWGGLDCLNPGYFAPAFYRVFAEFEPEQKNTWLGIIDASYEVIENSPGYANGLVPDWSTVEGASTGGAGYNAYFDGDALYKDAIRVHWRMATDYLWYGEPRAKKFLDNAYALVDTPDKANFYQMDGTTLPLTDTFELGNGEMRPRWEHSHLTVGMWACAAMGSGGPEAAEPFSEKLLSDFYTEGADFFGKASDPNGEDTLHNEMYFDQFLAWFGASIMSGVFTNLWEDFKDPDPTLPLAWETDPSVNTYDINASEEPFHLQGVFNKFARWTVNLVHRESNESISFSGNSDSLDLLWYGLCEKGTYMPQGAYDLTINARGLDTPVEFAVWLGKSMDLMHDNRLLVDDFCDGNLTPYIGKEWTSYLDSHEGGTGASQVTRFEVVRENGQDNLHWEFSLDQGNLGWDPYAALEWNCTTPEGNLDLTGIDTLVITARSQTDLDVSVQLVTSDIGDHNFYEDSLNLTSTSQEYRLPLAEFAQRWNQEQKMDLSGLSLLTAIRFQIQMASGTENAIIVEDMYFTGDVSGLYQSPPEYIESSLPVMVKRIHRGGYSLRKTAASYLISLPAEAADARATVVNARGAVVTRGKTAEKGLIQIRRDKLPAGVYFVKVRGNGMNLNIPLHNVR